MLWDMWDNKRDIPSGNINSNRPDACHVIVSLSGQVSGPTDHPVLTTINLGVGTLLFQQSLDIRAQLLDIDLRDRRDRRDREIQGS